MKNDVTTLLQSHRSIRKFKDTPIPKEVFDQLLTSAQWAPSSHNVQAYSIIVVKDPTKRKVLSKVAKGQQYVEKCPVFLVFCLDFYRLQQVSEKYGTPFEVDEIENLLVGAVDTALVAENVFIAAKSYGIGGVYIGGIRNNLDLVADLLELPPYTVPLFGMCLGYPDQNIWQKPRLSREAVIHYDVYQIENIPDALDEYESRSADYYTRRTNGARTDGWTKQMAAYLSKPRRPNVTDFIKKQGFKLT